MLIIEIIALIFLCKKNGQLAIRKGLKPVNWKIFTVLAWFGAEVFGCILGLLMFGQGVTDPSQISQVNLFQMSLIALFCAFGGYLLVKYILEQKPDNYDNDVNNIGIDDLKPPVK